MRRHSPAQVILPMLALPLLLVGLAMLVLPEPDAIAGPGHAQAESASRAPARPQHRGYFTLVPGSLTP